MTGLYSASLYLTVMACHTFISPNLKILSRRIVYFFLFFSIEKRPQCTFDFETRKKQMFTEAHAFSRVTYFFYFLASQLDFFLNLHSEISNLTTFSETVQRDDTNFGPFLFYSVAK